MSKKVLGVSWLQGKLQVVACRGHQVVATWQCSTPVRHPGEMAPLLKEAVRVTGFKGTDVQLVIDHRQLIYHVQDAPKGKTAAVRSILHRKVAKGDFFQEPAAWAHHPPIHGQEKQRFLLTLLPESITQGLVGAFQDAGLLLSGIFAPGSVLASQIPALRLPSHESTMLVADLGEALCLVAARADGSVLFCRHLASSTSTMRDRAGQEINRTLLYVQQQFGVSIETLWVYGRDAFTWLSNIFIREGIALRSSPVDEDPFYFATVVTSVPSRSVANLVPREEIRSRHMRRLSCLGAMAMLATALAIGYFVDREIDRRQVVHARWKQEWSKLELKRDALLFRQQEVQLLKEGLAAVGSTNDAPVIELFTRYLSRAVPHAIKLNGFSMRRREEGGFHLRIEGVVTDASMPRIAAIEALERELVDGDFHIQLAEGQPVAGTLQLSSAAGLYQGQRTFFIDGVLP